MNLPRDLNLRLLWGAIVGLITLVVFLWGSPLVDGAFVLVLWRLSYEWIYFKGRGNKSAFRQAFLLLGLSTTALFILTRTCGTWWALGTLVGGSLLNFMLAPGKYRNWNVLAMIYLGLPTIAYAWVLKNFAHGAWFVLWVILLVALTDTCAYFVGSWFQGPKLAPKISPNKTWFGFFGGIAGGFLGASLGLIICPNCTLANLLCFSVAVSLAAIIGDLWESYLKRTHGLKDTKPLIPGHGGLLDRLDAYLVAVPVAVALIRIFPGKLPFVLLP